MKLTHDFIAMNSAEKVLVSTVDCLLLNHLIGALLMKIMKPVENIVFVLIGG